MLRIAILIAVGGWALLTGGRVDAEPGGDGGRPSACTPRPGVVDLLPCRTDIAGSIVVSLLRPGTPAWACELLLGRETHTYAFTSGLVTQYYWQRYSLTIVIGSAGTILTARYSGP